MQGLKRLLSFVLCVVLVFVMLPVNQVYAWKVKTHNYSANLILDEVLGSGGKVTIAPFGQFNVDSEFYEALTKYPEAFRAGSLGPDAYPDIYVGQTYIHPKDGLTSGQWLTMMIQDANSLPKDSEDRKKIIAFMLGFMNHYSGDLFGHTYINQIATGEYPAFSDLADPSKAPHALEIILKHISAEGYIDNKIPSQYGTGGYINMDAPNGFILDSMIFDGAKENGLSQKYQNDPPYHFKYLVALREFVQDKANYYRAYGNSENFFDYIENTVICNYLDAWLGDIDAAINEWVNVSERIAKGLITNGTETDLNIAIGEIMTWIDTHGKYITPVPDILIDAMSLKGDIVKFFKDKLGITALQDLYAEFQSYLQELILDFFLYNVVGLTQDQINQMKNAFSAPNIVLGDKNIAQLEEDLKNYGQNTDANAQEFTPFYNNLIMTKLVLIGPAGYQELINRVKNGVNTGYNYSTGEAKIDNLHVQISTEDPWGPDCAGTDNDVYFGVVFNDGSETRVLCDKSGYNDFESGDNDTYYIPLGRRVKIGDIDKFFLQKEDVVFSDDWDPNRVKVSAYLGNTYIKFIEDYWGGNEITNSSKRYYDNNMTGDTYTTALNDGILSFIGSLDASMQWQTSSCKIWSDSDLRQDLFYKIFKDVEKFDNPDFDPYLFIDVIPPSISNIVKTPNTWYSGDVAVSFDVSDSFSGVDEVKWAKGDFDAAYFQNSGNVLASNVFYADENATYTIYADDKKDNVTVEKINITNIDKTKPAVESVIINNGSKYTNDNTVLINIQATDDISQVVKMKVSNYEDFSDATLIDYEENYYHDLIDTSGEKIVYVKVYDEAMNESDVVEANILLDIEYPEMIVATKNNEYNNTKKTISAFIEEEVSGIAKVKYGKGDLDTSYFISGGASIAYDEFKGYEVDVYENGFYTIYVEDKSGNATVETIKIEKIDKENPLINYSFDNYDGSLTNQDVVISIEVEDETSFIETLEYTLDGQNYSLVDGDKITIEGTYEGFVTIHAVDAVGNETTISTSNISIDQIMPTYTYSLNPSSGYVKDKIQITIVAEDNIAIESIEMVDGSNVNSNEAVFDVTEDGFETFYIKDSAGNKVIAVIEAKGIDKTGPSIPMINVMPNTFDSENGTIEGYTVEILPGVDKKIGTKETLYLLDNHNEYVRYESEIEVFSLGVHHIKAKSVDELGNVSIVASASFEVEKPKVEKKEAFDDMLGMFANDESGIKKETLAAIEKWIEEALEKTSIISAKPQKNAKSGEIVIGVSDILNNLKTKILALLTDENAVEAFKDFHLEINVVDKITKQLVYERYDLKGSEQIVVNGLKDNSEYLINLALVFGNKTIATRQLTRKTPDRTPPEILKLEMKNGVLNVQVGDNAGQSGLLFKFVVFKDDSALNVTDKESSINKFMATKDEQNDGWSSDATFPEVELGDRVLVMVKDQSGNESMMEIRIVAVDGMLYENVNGSNPLEVKVGAVLKNDDIIYQTLKKHNELDGAELVDLEAVNIDEYVLSSDNDKVAEVKENSITINNKGEVHIIVYNQVTQKRYVFFIEATETGNVDKSVFVKIGETINLKSVFGDYLLANLGCEKDIKFSYNSNLESLNDYAMLNENGELEAIKEGILPIKAVCGDLSEIVYVLIYADEKPTSTAIYAKGNLPYVINTGDILSLDDAMYEYDENQKQIMNTYVYAISSDESVMKINDYGDLIAIKKGTAEIELYDPISSLSKTMTVCVEDLKKGHYIKYSDIDKSNWAYSSIMRLTKLGILQGNQTKYSPNTNVTWEVFLTMMSRANTYMKYSKYDEKKDYDIAFNESRWSYPYVMDVMTMLSADVIDYVLGENPDFNKYITREEAAYMFAMIAEDEPKEAISVSYNDIENSRFKAQILEASEKGIFGGYDDGTFKPEKLLTRAEMSAIFNCYVESDEYPLYN